MAFIVQLLIARIVGRVVRVAKEFTQHYSRPTRDRAKIKGETVSRISAMKQDVGPMRNVRASAPISWETSARFLLSEDQFQRMVCGERKRAQRSRKHLLLILIEYRNVPDQKD